MSIDALRTAVAGLHRAAGRFDAAAGRIAAAPLQAEAAADAPAAAALPSGRPPAPADLAADLLDVRTAALLYKANARVAAVAARMAGETPGPER